MTLYRYLDKYRQHGFDGLKDHSRRPNTIHRTPISTANRIIELKKQHGWGPNKVEHWLRREDIHVSHTTIHKILCQQGLNTPINNQGNNGARQGLLEANQIIYGNATGN